MKRFINKTIALIVLVFIAAQANAAKIKVINATNPPTGIAVKLTLTGLTVEKDRAAMILPGESWSTDAGVLGFDEIFWINCGKIYKTKLDIWGVSSLDNTVQILGNTLIFGKSLGELGSATPITGEQIGDATQQAQGCPCIIR